MSFLSLQQRLLSMEKQTLLTLVGTVFLFLLFFFKNPSFIWTDTIFLLEILVLTLFTRTVSIRYGFSLFGQGVFLSAIFSMIIWWVLGILNLHDTVGGESLMAIFEELLKFAPVALAAFFLARNRKIHLNLSDFLFLSVMCAIGFSLFEKTFWQGVSFPFTYGPHIGNWYFFSDALGIYVGGEKFGYIGHAAATGLIGMGVGLGLLFRTQKRAWWLLFPLFAFLWVTMEHILSNLYYLNGTDTLLALGGGMLTPWIFLGFLIAVLLLDRRHLRQFLASHPEEQKIFQKNRQLFLDMIKTKKWHVNTIHSFFKTLRATHSLAWDKAIDKQN